MSSTARIAKPGTSAARARDEAVLFDCEGAALTAIVHHPEQPATTGVLVIVGGPQYRVGSHRQFVLLARQIRAAGFAAFRFDYRGMGDAEGDARDFSDIGADIRAAVDCFFACTPGLQRVILWGLCDAAAAASYYAASDPRVAGLVLLNPWVRSEAGEARAYLKHYYAQRLLSADFWRKVLSGGFRPLESLQSLAAALRRGARRGEQTSPKPGAGTAEDPGVAAGVASPIERRSPKVIDLSQRMADGLSAFRGRVLVVTSERDLTAQEFEDAARSHRKLRAALASSGTTRCTLASADHTFSRAEWRDEVAQLTTQWLQSV